MSKVVDGARCVGVCTEHLEAYVPSLCGRFGKINADSDRKMKEAAGGSAYRLGVVEIDGVPADQNGIGSERVGASDHRAEVAWVAYLITENHEPRAPPQRLIGCDVDHLADRNQPLGCHGMGQLNDGPLRRENSVDSTIGCGPDQIAVPVHPYVGHDQLCHGAGPVQRFGDCLATLGKKAPSRLAVLSPLKPAGRTQHPL